MASDLPPTGREPESDRAAPQEPGEPVPASSLRRVAAFLLDLVPVFAFHLAAAGGRWIFTFVFYGLYQTISLAVWGCTIGKAAVALNVQTPDGSRVRWLPALLRSTIGYLASTFFLLGFLHVFRDPKRRGWHDVLFGTEVVQHPGVLSVKQLIRAIDEWMEQLDAWHKRVLARYNRLRGLWQLLLKLTGAMTLVQKGVEVAGRWILSRTKARGAAAEAPAATGSATGAAAATGAFGTAVSAVTALAFAGASILLYQVSAPPALRLWEAKPRGSTALTGECGGTIVPSVTRGYEGDLADLAITIDPPFDKIITRVTTSNPRCLECDAAQAAPGRYMWRMRFEGKGPFRVDFAARDKEGKVRCAGRTAELTSLGPRQP